MYRALLIASLLALCGSDGSACPAPPSSYYLPSCVIEMPTLRQKVTLISPDWPNEISDHHFGDPDGTTNVVTVNIRSNGDRNFLVLTANEQTIWKIVGKVETVDEVLVLGAYSFGPYAAGVIGISPEKVTFTSPDLSFIDDIEITSCTRISRTCSASQWFGPANAQKGGIYFPEISQRRFSGQENVVYGYEQAEDPIIELVSPDGIDLIHRIDPAQVVSRIPPMPYEVLPSYPGLEQLIETGALERVDPQNPPDAVIEYGNRFVERYRDTIGLDLNFVPTVEYIIHEKVTLPPDLYDSTFFVMPGVPEPGLNGNDSWRVCLYYADRVDHLYDRILNREGGNPCRASQTVATTHHEKRLFEQARDFEANLKSDQ